MHLIGAVLPIENRNLFLNASFLHHLHHSTDSRNPTAYTHREGINRLYPPDTTSLIALSLRQNPFWNSASLQKIRVDCAGYKATYDAISATAQDEIEFVLGNGAPHEVGPVEAQLAQVANQHYAPIVYVPPVRGRGQGRGRGRNCINKTNAQVGSGMEAAVV
ncbi:UNVERIFIED_CONTAM: hypothetical protein HDU68_012745, partial [Siphonaria sp. JEL0065]